MNLITLDTDWVIRAATHKVLYRKAFPLTELDVIVLSFLKLYEDTIDFIEFGSLLGFAVQNNPTEHVYFDKAEEQVFSSLLDTLTTYHLIVIDKSDDGHKIIKATKWGIDGRLTGIKYKFYEGNITLHEHYQLNDWESPGLLFNFSKFGICSEIGNSKEIGPYSINEEDKASLYLQKALLNIKPNNEGNEVIEIDSVSGNVLNYKKLISKLSLSLGETNNGYEITTALNNIASPEIDSIILKESNSSLYSEWLLSLRYKMYVRDATVILAGEIAQYSSQVSWPEILSDSRVVWDSDFLRLLSSQDVTNSLIWSYVIQNCPEEILLFNLETYYNFWDWARLSKKINSAFIIKTANQFPWDIDVLIDRIDQNDLQQLLSTINNTQVIYDWPTITKKVSFGFIKDNIHRLPFDLYSILNMDEEASGKLILENLSLEWDWSLISSKYSLAFLINNIDQLASYLDVVSIVKRILKSEEEYDLLFNDNKFGRYLIENISKADFKIGKDQDIALSIKKLDFLQDNNLLFWGNEKIPGVEADQNLRWTKECFEKFGALVKSTEGYDQVSMTIDNIDVITDYITFPWNFRLISSRSDLEWSMQFIRDNKEQLLLDTLIDNISTPLVIENLEYFIAWSVELKSQILVETFVSKKLSFEEILQNRSVLNSNNVEVNWELVLKKRSAKSLGEIALSSEVELSELPCFAAFFKSLSSRCEISIILDNPRLKWDWELITKDRIDLELLLNDDFQLEYAPFLYWPYIIGEHILPSDLSPSKMLPSLAVLISQATLDVIKESWFQITRKVPPNDLWRHIRDTNQFEIFKWDWDYISSLQLIPIDHRFLSTYSNKINWKLLSANNTLTSFFKYSKTVYSDLRQWIDRTLEYLYAYQHEWDFASLSSINNLTWNERVVAEFEDKWDWSLLSQQSPLLTITNKDKRITEYDERRLRRFSRVINWGALSSRFEVTISTELVHHFSKLAWDWEKLSSHPRFELTKEFLMEHGEKHWDFKALSSHSFLKVDKELILFFKNKDWDFKLFSQAAWVDNDILLELSDKQWDWKELVKNKNLIFDFNLLNLITLQNDVSWDNILLSDSLHITPATIGLLVDKNILNKERWSFISSHSNLDFVQHPLLLSRFKDNWDWNGLIKQWKLDFNDFEVLNTYQDVIGWNLLSNSKNFSPAPDVLLKFKELLNWKVISRSVDFDTNGLRLFKEFLDWEFLSQNTSISFTEEMIDEFKMYWDYYYLLDNISIAVKIKEHVLDVIKTIPEIELYLKLKERQSNWAGYIYHFTHLTNAVEIIKNQKILSRNRAIGFADAAGTVVGRRHTAHQFARFYFRPQTPTQFYNECLGLDINHKYFERALRLGLPKCPIPVFFRFNLQEVLLKKRGCCYLSNGNMQTNWAIVKPVAEMLSKFNYMDVYSTVYNTSDGDSKTYINYSQQEFLITDEFDFSNIINFDIVVRTEKDKEELIRRMGPKSKFANRVIISSSRDGIYHNENRDIDFFYDNGELKLSTDYCGDGFKAGMFVVEFPPGTKYKLINGNIINATESLIYAYPDLSVKFDSSTNLKVFFQDDIKKTKWELYNLN
jgi:hypothetical protein